MSKVLSFSALFVLLCQASTSAALLAYEGFNGYADGATLASITPNAQTVGLETDTSVEGSSWANLTGNTAQTPNHTIANGGGLSFGSLVTSGGGLNIVASTRVASAIITSTTTSQVIWGSYLVNFASGHPLTGGSGLEVRLNTTPNSVTGNSFNRVNADSRGTTDSVIAGYGNSLSSSPSSIALTSQTTYMLVSKFDTGPAGGMRVWALTALQFDAFILDGRNESFLNANAYTIANSAQTAISYGWNNSYVEIVSSGPTGAGVIDEIRFGETLADVTPSSIPEPGSLALVGVGCLLFVRSRRR